MKKLAFACGALLLAATLSCTREQDVDLSRKMTFQAVWADNPDTRTAIQSDGTSVWWSPKEEISVFGTDGTSGKFTSTNTTPQATATFEGTLDGGSGGRSATRYIGVYPYRSSNDYWDEKVWLEVLTFQPGKEGTFADKAFPAISLSDDNRMTFYHVCGGARFSVANEGIGSVTFESLGKEPLAGWVKVMIEEDGTFVTEASDYDYSTSVTVTAPEGGFIPGKYYFAAFLPGTLSQGLNVTYTKLDGSFAEIALDKPITVNRARFGTIAGKDAGLTFQEYDITTPTAVDLGLSVKWASFNLGATKPEETGYYYAWGETMPKKVFAWDNYLWGESDGQLTKYNSDELLGTVDHKSQLDPEDDVAHVRLGDKWRMPVLAELEELMDTQYDDGYEWNFKTLDGVGGLEIVCLANGNSIFLPQTGFMDGTERVRQECAEIWSSSLLTSYSPNARVLRIDLSEYDIWPYETSGNRSIGLTVRPVYGDPPAVIPVESIALERSQIYISPELECHLKANVLPGNATDKDLVWSSSDESVADVYSGWISAVAPGTATITASTADGSKTATCQVTVEMPATTIATPEAVDLGLSVKWASFNVGATKPEETGNHYSWGETEPKSYYQYSNYKWYDPDADALTKYNYDSSQGQVDNKYELEAEDDVAHVKLGGDWRMPTVAEMDELIETQYDEDYQWQFKSINGTPGIEILYLANRNSIFMPLSGEIWYSSLSFDSSSYWTTSLEDHSPDHAQHSIWTTYSFEPSGPDDGDYYMAYGSRYYGASVRPVYGRLVTIPVESVTLNRTKLDLAPDIFFSLSATVLPQNATNKIISWTSSDESVATVDSDGRVHSVAPGTATITATTRDDGKTAACQVTVHDPEATFATPTAVDLGLSIPWASFNVGASQPEESGFHYAWGETEPKSQYDASNYRWCDGSLKQLTKYNFDPDYGIVDYKAKLEDADDVAHVKLGGKWRMPTFEEITELSQTRDNPDYQWTWKILESGCSGLEITYLVNGNQIFLPATGYIDDYYRELYSLDEYGAYWASSIDHYSLTAGQALMLYYSASDDYYGNSVNSHRRSDSRSVRPVYGDPPTGIPLESFSLNLDKVVIPVGARSYLEAILLPENTTEMVIWTSSDESVASVPIHGGSVKGIAPGTATITAMTPDGKKKATCQVTVLPLATTYSAPAAVDLGLSVKWGSFNLGATAPEDPGSYFAWGETEPLLSHLGSYRWYQAIDWDSGGYTKYCNNPDEGYNGFTDGKTQLDPEDDVVRVKLGGKWRMPTYEEIQELEERCTWTWTEQNGRKGCQVTGPNGKSIFLPATGFLDEGWLYLYDSEGKYLSTQLYGHICYLVECMAFEYWDDELSYGFSGDSRRRGLAVRPVCE